MRHSFLPAREQNALRRVYLVHVAVVALFLLSLVGLIGIGSLFPAYMSTEAEEKAALAEATSLKKDQVGDEAARIKKELQHDNGVVATLTETQPARPSAIVSRIIQVRGSVKLTAISVSDVASTTAVVAIQGLAPTRESLVDFKARLEALSPRTKVDLPISGFAKSKDLPFSIKITLVLK